MFPFYDRVVRRGTPQQIEAWVACLDAWLAIRAFRCAPGEFAATFENVSDRKQTEKASRYREELLDRIFEPGFSTRQAGMGIGLHMPRQIIEGGMGGKLSARNAEKGAEFTVLVPLKGGGA